MHNQRQALLLAATLGVAVVPPFVPSAEAAASRTFVSGLGADTGTCGRSAPCRSFAYALTQTASGGEITVLDSAGYGPVTIAQSVTITNPGGVEASITATTTDAVTVTAGTTGIVNLRGLTLVGSGTNNGITLSSAGKLNIQNCVISGFNSGMVLAPTGSNRVNVTDTIVSDNSNGISYFPSGSSATDTIFFERVQALGNQTNGFIIGGDDAIGGTVRGMVADSAATGNGSSGFAVSSKSGGAAATFTVVNSKAIGNTTGVSSSASSFNATLVLTRTTISGNGSGFDVAGNSRIDSYVDNQIFDMGNTGSLTSLTDQ
jgi:hypothetical protein